MSNNTMYVTLMQHIGWFVADGVDVVDLVIFEGIYNFECTCTSFSYKKSQKEANITSIIHYCL